MEEDEEEWVRVEVPAGMPGLVKAVARDWEEWVVMQPPEQVENVSARNADIGSRTSGEFPVPRQNAPNAAP